MSFGINQLSDTMFTGIIEDLGTVTRLKKEQDNLHLTIQSRITSELKIDQSVAHNGICLTVVNISGDQYTVTAIKETIDKTNIGELHIGDAVNLERAMKLGDRLDGHIVQGHVDQIGTCTAITEENGSWFFTFSYDDSLGNVTIEKGSATVNGVSLTVVNSRKNNFSVAIIPYTYEHTNFKHLKAGSKINLEFDVLGKYIQKLYEARQ
jgi:riboflavin synthase